MNVARRANVQDSFYFSFYASLQNQYVSSGVFWLPCREVAWVYTRCALRSIAPRVTSCSVPRPPANAQSKHDWRHFADGHVPQGHSR